MIFITAMHLVTKFFSCIIIKFVTTELSCEFNVHRVDTRVTSFMGLYKHHGTSTKRNNVHCARIYTHTPTTVRNANQKARGAKTCTTRK